MTVYNCILQHEENHWFKFNEKGLNVVGLMVAEKWREQGGTREHLDVVQSVERSGQTYMVFDYPTSFVPDIQETIKQYITNCTSKKKIAEKPQSAPIPISSPLPPKRPRKRIPASPIFSGRSIQKKH